jgi:hypothetical protein
VNIETWEDIFEEFGTNIRFRKFLNNFYHFMHVFLNINSIPHTDITHGYVGELRYRVSTKVVYM